VLIERVGERPASRLDLSELAPAILSMVADGTQVAAIEPCPLSGSPDAGVEVQWCLWARTTDRDVREIALELAAPFARHPELCIPMVVEVGVAVGCIQHLRPVSGR
jgi:hypothetical protein